ncbi:MAG TPA: hypothetical protein VFP56_08905 [Candidatus Limnocylindrales bacterium]|nr:hypothetical protein [Candidatus Limnocylindrales bacterium]
MTPRAARLSVGTILFGLLLGATPSSVFAECSNLIAGEGKDLNLTAAFLATVTVASDDVDPNADGNAWDWHVELTVDDVYRGNVPKALAFNGYDGGCAEFQGGALQPGDTIIVAAEELPLDYLPAAPFEGHSVVWHRISDGWSFFADAVAGEVRFGFYPEAAHAADSRAEILRFIASHSMPATDTDPGGEPAAQRNSGLMIALASAVALGVGLIRFRRRPLA